MKYPPHHAVELLLQHPDGELITLPMATVYGYGEIDPRRITSARIVRSADGKRERLFLEARPATSNRGRPAMLDRNVGALLACLGLTRVALPDLGLRGAQEFAHRRFIDLLREWDVLRQWPGIEDTQDLRKLREAKKIARDALRWSTRGLFVYEGTHEDFSGFLVVLPMAGSKQEASADSVRIEGPAWVWQGGRIEAEFCMDYRLLGKRD